MVTGVGTMATVGNTQQISLKEVPTPPVKSDRRSNKPIMEKRRRARINNCLNELKTLILDATKKDPARHSKLEKADILEKTVKHLQELQRQQSVMVQATDPKIVNKFKAGFTECANEVSRFPGLDTQVKRRLMQHLSNCINGVKSELNQIRQQQQITSNPQQQQQQVHILPSPPSSPEQDHHQQQHHLNNNNNQQQQQINQQQQQHIQGATAISTTQIQATANGYFLPNGVQVYPTKLSNGTFALILPQQSTQQQLPMLVPIPSRTASTGSATSLQSNNSNYDRTHSPIMNQQQQHHHHHHQQQNLINHYAPPSPANSYEAMDCQPQNHHQQHQSVIHHASSSSSNHHLNNRQSPDQQHHQQHHHNIHNKPTYTLEIESYDSPISLVMKKNNDNDNVSIKEEEQPWRPW